MATLLVFTLYYVVWLELPSFVTSRNPPPFLFSMVENKFNHHLEYP